MAQALGLAADFQQPMACRVRSEVEAGAVLILSVSARRLRMALDCDRNNRAVPDN